MGVVVVPYSDSWPSSFERESARLRAALGPFLVGAVEHVGSTAVPGLAAKPILDMLALVADLDVARRARPVLADLGYRHADHRPHEALWCYEQEGEDDGTTGAVATSTCCPNTATEHTMMGKLMVDSVVTLTRAYKLDGFRFDLMGHHSKQNMLDVRAALDALTLERDGVDGRRVYVYGEGWNFGEVADDARFVQATQADMAGTGIGTFNDRLRDALRGGGPFYADPRVQGFASGSSATPTAQRSTARPSSSASGCCSRRTRSRSGSPATSPATPSSTAPARR